MNRHGGNDDSDMRSQEFLTFILGGEEYAIDILRVQEIRGYEAVTPIAHAPEFIKGVMNLRGAIVPIIDLRIKFGLGRPEYTPFTVVVVLNVGRRVAGIVVDAVSDVIAVGAQAPRTLRFLLHQGLVPKAGSGGAEVRKLARAPEPLDFGGRLPPQNVPVDLWEATLAPGTESLSLVYGGVLDHPVLPAPGEQARGFAETPGTIGPEGVLLTGASFWIPWTGAGPFPFELTVDLPAGWDAVSQGRRLRHDRGPEATIVSKAGRLNPTRRKPASTAWAMSRSRGPGSRSARIPIATAEISWPARRRRSISHPSLTMRPASTRLRVGLRRSAGQRSASRLARSQR